MPKWKPSQGDAFADSWARFATTVVLVGGLFLVLVPAWNGIADALGEDPFAQRTTTTEVTTEAPAGRTVVRTVAPADESLIERSLASTGLLVLRVGIVLLIAFLAGAMVQRVLLARYGFKIGPLDLPEVKRAAEASGQATEDTKRALDSQQTQTSLAVSLADAAARSTGELTKRVEILEQKSKRRSSG